MQSNKKEEMRKHVFQWKQSGQTKKDYCKHHQISYYRFKYWCNQLGYVKKRATPEKTKSDFITLKPTDTIESQENIITITYPNGVHLNIPATSPVEKLTRLIRIYS